MSVWLKFLDRDQTKRECGYLLSKALHLGGDFRGAELGLVRDYVSQLYYFHQRPGCDSQENLGLAFLLKIIVIQHGGCPLSIIYVT